MTDDAIARYQKEAIVGQRPTWNMGTGPGAGQRKGGEHAADYVYEDPLGVFRAAGFAARATTEAPSQRRPAWGPWPSARSRPWASTNSADAATVKARYKQLVKQVHPDANGGDRSYEDRLREVINAYNTLKAAASPERAAGAGSALAPFPPGCELPRAA